MVIAIAGIAGALVIVEGVLQLAALVVRWKDRPRDAPAAGSGSTVVLCVGDSFTFGMGVSRESAYPARLATYLREGQPDTSWRVVNEGVPARNSAEMLAALPAHLERHAPAYVCILVGSTDDWNQAGEPAEQGAVPFVDRFVSHLRLARVVAGLRENPLDEPEAEHAPAPVTRPAPSSELTLETLEAGPLPGEMDQARLLKYAQVHAALTAQADTAGIVRLLRAASNEKLLGFVAREGEPLWQGAPSAELGHILALPIGRVRDESRGLAIARESVAMDSSRAEGWRVLAEAEWRWGNPEDGVLALAQAFGRGLDEASLDRWMRRRELSRRYNRAQFAAILERSALSPARRKELADLFDRTALRSEHERQLAGRLEEMVKLTRAANAQPVLLTYPAAGPDAPLLANECLRDLAERESIPLVDLETVFAQALTTTPTSDLFLKDWHCTARGYDLMARQVAAPLLAERPRQPGGPAR